MGNRAPTPSRVRYLERLRLQHAAADLAEDLADFDALTEREAAALSDERLLQSEA